MNSLIYNLFCDGLFLLFFSGLFHPQILMYACMGAIKRQLLQERREMTAFFGGRQMSSFFLSFFGGGCVSATTHTRPFCLFDVKSEKDKQQQPWFVGVCGCVCVCYYVVCTQ